MTYQYIPDLHQEAAVQPDGILSRVLHNEPYFRGDSREASFRGDSREDGIRTVIFAFDTGQELTEHTASRPATLQILSGHGKIKLAQDELEAKPGTWVYMPAGLVHAIRAESPLTMLLTLLPRK
ncbi:MAG TPA: cupin domain-containing protein [Meiothermus sp.]|jgi:quercetin dioxygenase-like cupin family protein|nr:cupin domain-containing protein [Meiothermus sp.]